MGKINIFKASAGSGKTFQLSREYLELAFRHPLNFRHILAVTFTNKATREMKSRILDELHTLAYSSEGGHREYLRTKYNLSDESLTLKAQSLLNQILNDYSHFSITTIDRFFQQILRSLARELGLQGEFQVELNQDLILLEAINRMMDELDQPNAGELINWLTRFSETNIEEGKPWNLKSEIFNLGNEIFKEHFLRLAPDQRSPLADKPYLLAYRKKLSRYAKDTADRIASIGIEADNIIHQHGLEYADFIRKASGPVSIFKKWKEGQVPSPGKGHLGLVESPDHWHTKSAPQTVVDAVSLIYPKASPLLQEAFELTTLYNSTSEILKNFYALGLLTDLLSHVRSYEKDSNSLLLSNSAQLLRSFTNASDIPFVYEKIGSFINHYMIDEFQDTSGMQWDNFRPLLENSIAGPYDSMIVGDVKQSIYRFRNSDWSLFSEKIHQDFFKEQQQTHVLEYNWRSSREIIEFNNYFFAHAIDLLGGAIQDQIESSSLPLEKKERLSSRITNAYQGLEQTVPEKHLSSGGYISIQSLEAESSSDFRDEAIALLPQTIDELLQRGYTLSDIAILVTKNSQGAQVVSELMKITDSNGQAKYQFISDEALKVANADSVQLLICILKSFFDPNDEENLCHFFLLFQQLILGKQNKQSLELLSQTSKEDLKNLSFIPEEMCDKLQRALGASIYQTLSLAVDIIQIPLNPYLNALLDAVWNFEARNNGNLELFLDWWKTKGHQLAVSSEGSQGAIQVMTIHKSKGLEFDAVIIPFADWEMVASPRGKAKTLWVEPSEFPFNELPIVPIRYTQSLKNSIFAEDYFTETIQNYVDSINLAYVAFTRARHDLHIITQDSSKKKSSTIKNLSQLASLILEGSFSANAEDNKATFGHPNVLTKQNDKVLPPSRGHSNQIRRPYSLEKLSLRYKHEAFSSQTTEYGTLMHLCFGRIRTLSDIPKACSFLEEEGFFASSKAKEEFHDNLSILLNQDIIKDWFSEDIQTILNERSILTKEEEYRPDRVIINGNQATIIDFKFGKESNAHARQVKKYSSLYKSLGYQTKSYLWYVKANQIAEI